MCSRGTPGSADQVMAAIDAIDAAFDALADAPFWQLSSDQVAEFVRRMQRIENRAVATQVTVVGEGISRGLPALAGCKTGKAWLRGLVPVTPYVAWQRAALAEDLPGADLAPTREAFRVGSLAAGHASAVSRTMSELDRIPEVDPATWAEAQRLLVAESERVDPVQLGRAGLHLRRRLDPQGPDRLARDEDAQADARYATLRQESSGMWYLTACLPPLEGAMVHAVLDPLAAPRPTADGSPDRRLGQQRLADAVVTMAELSLAQRGGDRGALPTRHGSPVRLNVTGDIQTLLADPTVRYGPAGVAPAVVESGEPGGWDGSALTFQMLACDAEVVPVLLDSFGRPLDVGDSQYRFPPRIRRAIEIRDAHCTFPSCLSPPTWCHTHHLVPFGRKGKPGGPTSEGNGTLLCGRHHRFIHGAGWVGRLVDGHVAWRPPRSGTPDQNADEEADALCTAYAKQFEVKLRQLALRWLARNPELRNTR
jgi:hypothetical protein